MARLLAGRLLWAVPLLCVVTLFVFLLVDLAPGDPAVRIAGPDATAARVEQVRHDLQLDDPVLQRYGRWLGDAVHGDFGESFATGQPVTEVIEYALWPTLSLIAVGTVIALLLGGIGGLIGGTRRDGVADRTVSVVGSVALATPAFWIALILLSLFALQRRWLPALGYAPMSDGFGEWLKHLILPAFALALVPAAETALQLKAALHDVQDEPYLLVAEAKGLSSRKILFKHSLKNALAPVVTVFGYRIAQMLGGVVILEQIFNIHGLGTLAVTSVLAGDMPVMLGLVVMSAIVVIVMNALVDVSLSYFNPKVRA